MTAFTGGDCTSISAIWHNLTAKLPSLLPYRRPPDMCNPMLVDSAFLRSRGIDKSLTKCTLVQTVVRTAKNGSANKQKLRGKPTNHWENWSISPGPDQCTRIRWKAYSKSPQSCPRFKGRPIMMCAAVRARLPCACVSCLCAAPAPGMCGADWDVRHDVCCKYTLRMERFLWGRTAIAATASGPAPLPLEASASGAAGAGMRGLLGGATT
jgi:hypothetical protein